MFKRWIDARKRRADRHGPWQVRLVGYVACLFITRKYKGGDGQTYDAPLWYMAYRLCKKLGLRDSYLDAPVAQYLRDRRDGLGFCPRRKTAQKRAEALRQRESETPHPL